MKTLILISVALFNGYSNSSSSHCERYTGNLLSQIIAPKEKKAKKKPVLNNVAEDYCQDIESRYDKFTSKTTYSSPSKYYIIYYKIVSDSTKTIMLRLSTSGATLNLGKTGVTILLEDGSKLEYPDAPVKYESIQTIGSAIFYKYYSYVELDEDDLAKLIASPITDYRLYVYDATVRDKHKERFKQYAACIR